MVFKCSFIFHNVIINCMLICNFYLNATTVFFLLLAISIKYLGHSMSFRFERQLMSYFLEYL